MSHALQFYIDGAWVDPAGGLKTLDVIDPSTEEAFAKIALGSQRMSTRPSLRHAPPFRLSPRPRSRSAWR
jgi:acyl-CoA reductase-like NAD-dependent aldehyde dehydrogenase